MIKSTKDIDKIYDIHFWVGIFGLIIGYTSLGIYFSHLLIFQDAWEWVYYVIVTFAIINLVVLGIYAFDKSGKYFERMKKHQRERAISNQATLCVVGGLADIIVGFLLGGILLWQGFIMAGVGLISGAANSLLNYNTLVEIMTSEGFSLFKFMNTMESAIDTVKEDKDEHIDA